MANKKFKALITFASGPNMFYPFEDSYEAPEELVNDWAKVNYVKVIEEPQPVASKLVASIQVDGEKLAKEIVKEVEKKAKIKKPKAGK